MLMTLHVVLGAPGGVILVGKLKNEAVSPSKEVKDEFLNSFILINEVFNCVGSNVVESQVK